MKLSKTKKIILLTVGLTVLTTSIVTPIVLLNKDENNKENDVEKLFKILKAKTAKEKIIELPSDASGKIIANNQEKIIEKIKTLIGTSNLKKVKIEVSMNPDQNISTISQKIIIKLTKNKVSKEIKDFLVRKQSIVEVNEDIAAIRDILDSKSGEDLKIILLKSSTGNIIGNAVNKKEIIKKLRILIDPSNTNGEANHSSLRGTSIRVSMNRDAAISISFQNIIVSITKVGGTTLRTTKIFKVKKESTPDEDILAIKNILDSKTGEDLKIILSSDSTGNIIGNRNNKNAIKIKLEKLINPLDIGEGPDSSLRGTRIEVSMSRDAAISTSFQNIIVSITKVGGTTLRTTKIFKVKKESTPDKSILAIKNILDSKTGEDLKIILPSSSTGNIIGNRNNKIAIIKKIIMLIDPSNTSGEANHSSLRGTSIRVSMSRDATISTIAQDIIVSIVKIGGTTLTTSKTFQVRHFTPNEDIAAIRDILDAKTNHDLIITLPRSSTGNIIGKTSNKNEIIKKIIMLIDPSNTSGEANHSSLRGTSIDISMSRDAPISIDFQDIIVSISKTGGTTLRTTKIFKIKKESTPDEDIAAIRDILNNKTGNDLIITLPSDTIGTIINNLAKIVRKLRILIDSSNTNGEANHWSLRGTWMNVSPQSQIISTNPKNILVFIISKTNGATSIIENKFQVKKA